MWSGLTRTISFNPPGSESTAQPRRGLLPLQGSARLSVVLFSPVFVSKC